jgi:hypothetical protein
LHDRKAVSEMRGRRLCVALAVARVAVVSVGAQAADSPYDWKLTLGEYFYSNYAGTDANLRWRASDTSAWVGAYTDSAFGSQFRTGADTSLQVAKYLQLQPSVQLASRGFLGGSFNVQVGGAWYGLVGIGRTDARPYFNLNFDPNDAMTYGVGHTGESGLAFEVFVIEDNRFHTGQRDWHANAQIPFGDSHATLDVLHKAGLSDVGHVSAWGGTLNYEWPRWFARLAYDPYQNFSAQSAWRVAGGVRF